jgi:hypothetical protein
MMAGTVDAADPYPVKPTRWIVPTSAGSGADTVGRIVTNGLAQVTGQTVVVENRAGAAGNIAAEFVAKAPKDGYTVLQANFSHGVNMSLYKKLGYDLLRDFAAVTNLGASPALLVVHPSLPVKNAKEFISCQLASFQQDLSEGQGRLAVRLDGLHGFVLGIPQASFDSRLHGRRNAQRKHSGARQPDRHGFAKAPLGFHPKSLQGCFGKVTVGTMTRTAGEIAKQQALGHSTGQQFGKRI